MEGARWLCPGNNSRHRADTPDGYLWLGTDSGLYRFDGVRAVLWQPPAGQQLPSSYILRLMVSRDGTLWIGTRKGLANWKNGQVTRYSEIAERGVLALLEDHEGTIWVGEWQTQPQGRLCAIHRDAVECYGTDGSVGWGVLSLFEDSKGNLWVGGGGPPKFGFWHWKPGAPKFYTSGVGAVCFAENSEGELLIGTPQGLMRLVDGRLEPHSAALPQSTRGLSVRQWQQDSDGALWIGISGAGLVHIHHGRTDVFTEADGLSWHSISSILEDREGNVWVATNDGLDRFRNFAVSTWSARQGVLTAASSAVLAGNDGAIWAGAFKGLTKLREGEVTVYHQRPERGGATDSRAVHERIDRRLPHEFYALHLDHNGRLWISSRGGLGYLEGERFLALPSFGTRIIMSLAEGSTGDLWVEDQENGLFRLRDGKVTQHIPWDTLRHKDLGGSLAVDQVRGGLWIGFGGGGIVYLKDGQVRASYLASDGLGEGAVNDLRFGPRGTLWASTNGGLSRIKDGHLTTLTSKNGLSCDEVHWSIEDDDHFVWLYMACGLVRIARSELDAWANDPKRKVQARVFDANDGVRTVGQFSGFHPQVSKAPDGRIWFAAVDGVSVIDPRHLPYNKVAPPVHVEQVTADRKSYDAASDGKGRLPPLVRDLEIDYTALSFVVPEKVRFRYKLEGLDRDWQEVGNRRQAFYTNLPPRSYRFLVKACNNSGVWNEEGAALDFAIAPAYYQANWFRALCVAAFMALLWAFYQLRLRQLAREFNMRLDERVSERTRIARELHDTLLQSFHGVLLLFQAVANELQPGKAKQRLENAIDRAAEAITEGRDAVTGLRASTVERNDLADAMKTLGEGLAARQTNPNPVGFCVAVEGTSRDLRPILRDEVYRIAVEAVRNAFRHADAKKIEVEIHYDDRRLRVRVRDDGKGIDPKLLGVDGRERHFGLLSMRERAKLIGGKLTVWSELEAGTEVELSIPAERAYTTSTEGLRSWFAKKISRK